MAGTRFTPRAQGPRAVDIAGLRELGMPGVPQMDCIFVIVDYQDYELARHLPAWRWVITQYGAGGEIEECLGARVTHILAKDQKSPVAQQAIQWLNHVLFGSMNADQSMNNPRYQQFKPVEPLRIDYALVPHLIQAWKVPILCRMGPGGQPLPPSAASPLQMINRQLQGGMMQQSPQHSP